MLALVSVFPPKSSYREQLLFVNSLLFTVGADGANMLSVFLFLSNSWIIFDVIHFFRSIGARIIRLLLHNAKIRTKE